MPLSDRVLITAAITAANLDPANIHDRTQFASLLAISERAVRNWRNGRTISAEYRRWLERFVELDDSTRLCVVQAIGVER